MTPTCTERLPILGLVVAFSAALAVGACAGPWELAGRATDEWTRSYPLGDGGQVEITNSNGIVEIEGVTGSTVEVRAERVAQASSDSSARDLLSHVTIKEDVAPVHIGLETERINGLVTGGRYEVHYHLRIPKSSIVRATTTNGRIILTRLSGKTTATTTNGGVSADALAGGIVARSTNGMINVELAALGSDKVDLQSTNGQILLTLPVDARADVDASVTNGAISVTGLQFQASDQSRRHLSGRINGGGTPVSISTTNGAIRIGVQ